MNLQRINDTMLGAIFGYGIAVGGWFLHGAVALIVFDVVATLLSIRSMKRFNARLRQEIAADERRLDQVKRAIHERCERERLQ